jgi:hypothetical protein
MAVMAVMGFSLQLLALLHTTQAAAVAVLGQIQEAVELVVLAA